MSLTLFLAWSGTTFAFLKAAVDLEKWMPETVRVEVSKNLQAALATYPTGWIRGVNTTFFVLFDRLYRSAHTRFDKIVWRGILGAYVILFLARLVLWAFQLPPPPTEIMLVTALVIVSITGCLVNTMYLVVDVRDLRMQAQGPSIMRLVISQRAFAILASASLGFVLFIVAATELGHRMGTSVKMLIAYSIGVTLATLSLLLLYLIPDRFFPISPSRTLFSSVLAMVLVGLYFRDASVSAFNAVLQGRWQVCTYVCFNIFADAISLVETRWVLKRSGQGPLLTVFAFLVVDLALSAAVFLVLPGIADQDRDSLVEGILLDGTQPWLGILFWSTFATSALFYTFVIAALVVKILTPILALFRCLNCWFSIYEYPMRTIAFSMVIVESLGFAYLAFQ